jgi:hypothetical protein
MLLGRVTDSKAREASHNAALQERQRAFHLERESSMRPDIAPALRPRYSAGSFRRQVSGLQRAIGNQAVLRMLSSTGPGIQTKLAVSQPGDQYEREADRVAEQVMRMPDSSHSVSGLAALADHSVQRKCECNGSDRCDKCKEEHQFLQRQAASDAAPQTETPSIVQSVLRSAGEPLSLPTRRFMEPRFGVDLGSVRVHVGPRAAESAAAVNALAYTVGSNIVFASGQYQPGSPKGQKLLAHELAHVVQQSRPSSTRWGYGAAPAKPSRGASLQITQNSSAMIQRKVAFKIVEWSATKLQKGGIVPTNSADGDSIVLDPPTRHILISGIVEVNGDATDDCAGWKFGTTQTAWMDWAIQYYWGRTAKDGHAIVRRKRLTPVRDPDERGNIWYDNNIVESPSSCGDEAGVFHVDAPFESIPKTVQNDKTKATNYLTGYTRGLHLVTYLTAMDPSGNFLKTPLRFRYWNALHDFVFTPNFTHVKAAWKSSGPGVRINIGSQGHGETSDAPYFTTAGPTFNQRFNDDANVHQEDFA